jgi:inosine/xanthosine triphosphate pyrophosphatase family protein
MFDDIFFAETTHKLVTELSLEIMLKVSHTGRRFKQLCDIILISNNVRLSS